MGLRRYLSSGCEAVGPLLLDLEPEGYSPVPPEGPVHLLLQGQEARLPQIPQRAQFSAYFCY